MNEQLTERILEYLQLETTYAVILTGDYGIGKTHYLKKELFPQVKELKIDSKNEETFTPILISLFGVKSIEDIQNQILFELYPILKKKGVKIAAGIGKALYKFVSGSEFNDLLSDTGTTSSDIIDFTKILLCIDDIDRKSPTLNIKDFFGFVNNLVENYEAKILLIANEDELKKEVNTDENEDSYSVLREKVIGVSVTYYSNLDLVYDQIIKSRYQKENLDYYSFLSENKTLIIFLIEKNKKNLRNLMFFLEHFKVIFKTVIHLIKSQVTFAKIKNEILVEILKFSLPISIEYKVGRLNSENSKDIEDLYDGFFFDLDAFLGEKKEKKEKTYSDYYKENYFENSNAKRFFFASVYNYILGKTSLDVTQLISDINSTFNFEEGEISEKQEVLSKLSSWQCLNLSQKEYRRLTVKLLTYVDLGDFELEEYPSIYRHVIRFNNVLSYDLDRLIKRFKRGIDKGTIQKHSMHFRINKTDEFFPYIEQIANYCLEVSERIKLLEFKKEIEELYDLSKTNFTLFLEKMEEPNTTIYYIPIFSKFGIAKFLKIFKKLTNKEIIDFSFFLHHKYRKGMASDLFPDRDFIEEIINYSEKKLSEVKISKFKSIAYEILVKKGREVLTNFD